jgi:hypothetical protein
VSRTQLLENDQDDEQSPPSDSRVEDSESEDESQVAQEDESDTSEPARASARRRTDDKPDAPGR